MLKQMLSLIQWRDTLTAVPDFLLGMTYLFVWMFPSAAGVEMIPTLTLVLLLEFITILFAYPIELRHCSGDPPEQKTRVIRTLVLLFLVCCSALSVVFQEVWPIIAGTILMLNRLLAVLFGRIPAGKERVSLRIRAVTSVILLLWSFSIVQAIAEFPGIGLPLLGITETLRMEERFLPIDPVEVLAMGFCYYCSLGLFELLFHYIIQRLDPETLSRAAS